MIIIGLLTNNVISANYGVNALSLSNILLIERCLNQLNIEHHYILFGNIDKAGAQIDRIKRINELNKIKIEIVPELEFRRRKSYAVFIRNIKRCDVVFDTSGGDSYSDIYGNNRLLHQFLPKLIALALQKRLILSPQTIGPFKKHIWEHLCKYQLKKCFAVFARDNASYELGKNEFELNNIYLVTDMAMILPFDHNHNPSSYSSNFRVGVNVSGLLYNGGYTSDNQFNLKLNYKNFIDRLINMLIYDISCEVHLIPHVITTGVESDNEACAIIKKKYPNVIYEEVFGDPIEAKSYISNLDLLIGSRMHSTIAAISSGIPVLPLSYSRKFEGLFESIGYRECINLKEIDEEQALTTIKMSLDRRAELCKEAQRSNSLIKEKMDIYTRILGNLLGSIGDENK